MLTQGHRANIEFMIKTDGSTLMMLFHGGKLTTAVYPYRPFSIGSGATIVNTPGHGILYYTGKDKVHLFPRMHLVIDYIVTLAGGTHDPFRYSLFEDFVVLGPLMATVARLKLEQK